MSRNYWARRRNLATAIRLLRAFGALAALLAAGAASAADKPPKPVACLSFEVFTADSGAKLVRCYDNKRPFTFTGPVVITKLDGRPVAVGYR